MDHGLLRVHGRAPRHVIACRAVAGAGGGTDFRGARRVQAGYVGATSACGGLAGAGRGPSASPDGGGGSVPSLLNPGWCARTLPAAAAYGL